eukprot:5561261-Pleurochrysis_carterae.AAC.6
MASIETTLGIEVEDEGKVHITDKESYVYVVLHLPKDKPKCKLLCLSDTHCMHDDLTQTLPAADILVHTGDFTFAGRQEEIESFSKWVDALIATGRVRHAVFIAGNHELSLELSARHEAVRKRQRAMKEALQVGHERVQYLEDSSVCIDGLHFYGSPWTTLCGREWAFQERDTIEGLGRRFSAIPDNVDVLLTHQPPRGQGDHGDPTRAGSQLLLQKVLEVKPLVHAFGHIHAGNGVSRHADLRTLFVNSAVCDDDWEGCFLHRYAELLSSKFLNLTWMTQLGWTVFRKRKLKRTFAVRTLSV